MNFDILRNKLFLTVLILQFQGYAFGAVEGVYAINFKGNKFELILCHGKFSIKLYKSKREPESFSSSCIKFLSLKPFHFDGVYKVENDTLLLSDLNFGNQYRFVITRKGMVPITPNYTFLLWLNQPLKKIEKGPDFLSSCFQEQRTFNKDSRYRRWWVVDTSKSFLPEAVYVDQDYEISFQGNFVKVLFNEIIILEGSYKLENNRIILYSVDLQKQFILFNGNKSFRNLIVNIDPLLFFRSFHKKYSEKEWNDIIHSAKEFRYGGEGAGPNIELTK
jgi:hypothetical protein